MFTHTRHCKGLHVSIKKNMYKIDADLMESDLTVYKCFWYTGHSATLMKTKLVAKVIINY